MSGWAVYRSQPSTAVWGGIASGASNAIPVATGPLSGWAVYRSQPSTAVWGGIAAVSNVPPAPAAAAAAGGFQDRRPGYLKKRILFGM